MALGDFYVEEDEASDEGPDDAAAAVTAAANDIPVGTPRVAREALAAVRREARAVWGGRCTRSTCTGVLGCWP